MEVRNQKYETYVAVGHERGAEEGFVRCQAVPKQGSVDVACLVLWWRVLIGELVATFVGILGQKY